MRNLRPWVSLTRAPMLILVALLHGCGGTSVTREAPGGGIQIASDPSGATVLVDGVEIGTTPLRIDPAQVFRSGFVGLSYRYFGKLMIRKAGCREQVIDVNDAILAKDVNVKLECDPDYRAPQPAQQTPAAQPATSAAPAAQSEDPYVERLQRIETLYRKGLITKDEYQASRKRIIDKL